jgi:hypothetical protein
MLDGGDLTKVLNDAGEHDGHVSRCGNARQGGRWLSHAATAEEFRRARESVNGCAGR